MSGQIGKLGGGSGKLGGGADKTGSLVIRDHYNRPLYTRTSVKIKRRIVCRQ